MQFKTQGHAMKDSKLVTVFLTDHDLRFEPKNNRYSQVKRRQYEYQGMRDEQTNIGSTKKPSNCKDVIASGIRVLSNGQISF
jgi:hypothetical protein